MRMVVFLVLALASTALAESPLEAVRAFQKECAAKDEAAALKRIAGSEGAGENEDAYFRQKARRLIEMTGEPGRKAEAVAEKTEEDFAVAVMVVSGPGERREVEALYLKKAGDEWRIVPFSNWRKLSLTEAEKKVLEGLETWYEGEERKRMPETGGVDPQEG